MITDSQALSDTLVDEALVSRMVPWPCPSDFGPDGRYRLEEVIGVGQTSLVYRAVDTNLSSETFEALVAIKIVGAERTQRQEALNARRVRHENVVRIIDRGVTDQGVSFIVEELVEGSTLASKTPPWAPRSAASFVAKLARGMQAVHDAGVVHCDLKPANVLIGEDEEPRISDFGLARAGDIDEDTGGNLAFMSPERLLDPVGGLTPSTDVYALAGLLYYLLTGRSPNGDDSASVRSYLMSESDPPRLGVDRTLDAICLKRLSRDPNVRDSAGAFADDLECWVRHEPVRWMNPSRFSKLCLFVRRHFVFVGMAAVVAALLLAFVGGCVWLNWQAQRNEIRSQQRAVDIANQNVDEIKERVKSQIRFMSLIAPRHEQTGLDLAANTLVTLMWLERIVDHPVLEDVHETTVAPERVRLIRELANELHASGQGETLSSLLADHALAYYLIYANEFDEAAAVSAQAIESWKNRIDEREPIWRSLKAIHETAAVLQAQSQGAPPDELRSRLDAVVGSLEGVKGCNATLAVVLEVEALIGG